MNIEDLSKSQLLLLMLLVNFVVSIATGILTVSLLDEAPATITQTVNQIVDRTVETIAATSSPLANTPLASIIVPPTPVAKTVVQGDNELIPVAIAADSNRSVSIYSTAGTTTPLIAVGTYLPKSRAVVTDTLPGLPQNVTIEFANGSTLMASLSHEGATITIYGFGDTATLPTAPTPLIAPAASVKQGETVVGITADGAAVTGIISKIDSAGVHASLPVIPAGNTIVDISGNIVGISTGAAGLFYPADKITSLLTATSSPTSS